MPTKLTKSPLSKYLLSFLLILALLFCSRAIYARLSTDSLGKIMPAEKEKNYLVSYLNEVLVEAGVPEDIRKYLIDTSRNNLSKVSEMDIAEKKELLKENLYILLIKLASKNRLLLRETEINYPSKGYGMTAQYFLSNHHLKFLKSNQIFNELTKDEMKITFQMLCPIWPWC